MRAKIFEELQRIADIIPAPLYWLDTKGTFLGGNELCLDVTGAKSLRDFIGKTYDEIHPPGIAEELVENIQCVLKRKKTIETEEVIKDFATGKTRYLLSIRTPLFENKQIVGIVATSIDITDRKEKERLEAENKAHIARSLDQQLKFREISAQLAHDIGSPLAALQMVIPHCDTLPENTRNVLNKSAIRIADIAENFLSQFKPHKEHTQTKTIKEPTLISAEILEVLTEKKYQYSKHAIEFVSNISQAGAFAFIEIDSRSFKRMLSNLINNAVEAIDGKSGEVIVSLENINDRVKITVTDNGKGMPGDIKDKLLSNIQVTAGKIEGHGIGYTQIRDTITQNNGSLSIESERGKGTQIIVTFPQTVPPDWMAEGIDLQADDLVVVLDDDESIHDAWETRFENAGSGIKRQHFKHGRDAIEFINKLGKEAKHKVFLLTDYELLRQGLNGLDVIAQTGITRSVLVTSHHNDLEIQDKAKLMNTRILPKPLASVIEINAFPNIKNSTLNGFSQRQVDLVILDDDIKLIDTLIRYIVPEGRQVDKYYKPQDMLNNLEIYPKQTKFLIDNQYKGEMINGLIVAERLKEYGYTNLYLFTNEVLDKNQIPDHVQVIAKDDIGKISSLLESELCEPKYLMS